MAARTPPPSTKPFATANKPQQQANQGRWLECMRVVTVIGGGVLGVVALATLVLLMSSREKYTGRNDSLSSCVSSLQYPCMLFPSLMIGLFVGLPMGVVGGANVANRLN